jgi:hypothetical protein
VTFMHKIIRYDQADHPVGTLLDVAMDISLEEVVVYEEGNINSLKNISFLRRTEKNEKNDTWF